MSHQLAQSCRGQTRARSAPVDCIYPTPDEPEFAEAEQLCIDPQECSDCGACVEAITSEDQVPPEWKPYIAKTAAYFRALRR